MPNPEKRKRNIALGGFALLASSLCCAGLMMPGSRETAHTPSVLPYQLIFYLCQETDERPGCSPTEESLVNQEVDVHLPHNGLLQGTTNNEGVLRSDWASFGNAQLDVSIEGCDVSRAQVDTSDTQIILSFIAACEKRAVVTPTQEVYPRR